MESRIVSMRMGIFMGHELINGSRLDSGKGSHRPAGVVRLLPIDIAFILIMMIIRKATHI